MSSVAVAGSPVVWEDVPCPLCEARAEVPVLETGGAHGERFRLVRCGGCGLGYHNPRPDEASIARFYPDDYESYHCAEGRTRRTPAWLTRLKLLAAARRCGAPVVSRGRGERWLAGLLAPWLAPESDSLCALPYTGRGRLLEYGCGTGWLARRMRDLGWDVTGMDFSPFAAAQARRLFGLDVIVGSLPHPAVGPESYDAVVMGQVLEHVHRPHGVIAAAARALRPGGLLAVNVPNCDGWGFRTFGQAWWGLQLPIHLLHFTPATLRRLLEAHGLEVVRASQPRRPGWMRRSLVAARHRAHLPLWLRVASRSRLAAGLLARWSAASGQGDCLQIVARRPTRAAARRVA